MTAYHANLIKKHSPNAILHWTTCPPFVENQRGVLIHRPKHVTRYQISSRWKPHLAVGYLCGAGTVGDKHLTFLTDVPSNRFLCHMCEAIAAKSGLPSADIICGRHVHVGKVVARQVCCVSGEHQ